jgi:predicted AlkP superfamily phosphohydrolase/phosphomutase
MDDIVGEIQSRLDADTVLLVVSDHGFHSFREGLNVNTWLREHGYLLQFPTGPTQPDGDFLPNVDWSRTRAYALGTGQIYVNLRGREGRGIVAPGLEYRAVLAAIRDELEAEVDPATGERVVERVYEGSAIFPGASPARMPDLQIAFRDGYRTSWRTPVGAIPAAVFERNLHKWSGDHAASDVADTPGVIVSSRRLAAPDPGIVDVAPTALTYLGVPVPAEMEGRPLLEAGPR